MNSMTINLKSVGKPHCSNCGISDYEALYTGDQGYTACCNEPLCDVSGWDVCAFVNDPRNDLGEQHMGSNIESATRYVQRFNDGL